MAGRRRPRVPALCGWAIVVCVLLLVAKPSESQYLYLLRTGNAYAMQGERIAALTSYRAACEFRPGDPEPHLLSAGVYSEWGRTEHALDEVATARDLGASALAVDRALVAVHATALGWAAAEASARRVLEESPNDTYIRHRLAMALCQQGKWQAAGSQYTLLVQAEPTDWLAHERLGLLLLGEDESALGHLRSGSSPLARDILAAWASPLAAEGPEFAHMLTGRELVQEEEWALAALHFERALRWDAELSDSHAYLGYALGRMGQEGKALVHLQRALTTAPDSPMAHMLLGLHYASQGHSAAARAEYETAYDLDPENAVACIEIGRMWSSEGAYTTAEVWLGEAVRLEQDNAEAWAALARFYLGNGLDVAGKGTLAAERAAELAPNDARTQDLRGWAALLRGDLELAERSLSRATELDPYLAQAQYHLGLLWDLQNALDRAADSYTRALNLDTSGQLQPLIDRAVGDRWQGITQGVLGTR